MFSIASIIVTKASNDCKLVAEVLMAVIAVIIVFSSSSSSPSSFCCCSIITATCTVLALATGNTWVNHYSLPLDSRSSSNNIASTDMRQPNFFTYRCSYSLPGPDIKVIYAAVFDINDYFILACNRIWKIFMVLQYVYRSVFKKRNSFHNATLQSGYALPSGLAQTAPALVAQGYLLGL